MLFGGVTVKRAFLPLHKFHVSEFVPRSSSVCVVVALAVRSGLSVCCVHVCPTSFLPLKSLLGPEKRKHPFTLQSHRRTNEKSPLRKSQRTWINGGDEKKRRSV